jgi:hypothetical protein
MVLDVAALLHVSTLVHISLQHVSTTSIRSKASEFIAILSLSTQLDQSMAVRPASEIHVGTCSVFPLWRLHGKLIEGASLEAFAPSDATFAVPLAIHRRLKEVYSGF